MAGVGIPSVPWYQIKLLPCENGNSYCGDPLAENRPVWTARISLPSDGGHQKCPGQWVFTWKLMSAAWLPGYGMGDCILLASNGVKHTLAQGGM